MYYLFEGPTPSSAAPVKIIYQHPIYIKTTNTINHLYIKKIYLKFKKFLLLIILLLLIMTFFNNELLQT